MIFDTHIHLNDDALLNDIDNLINNAKEKGRKNKSYAQIDWNTIKLQYIRLKSCLEGFHHQV